MHVADVTMFYAAESGGIRTYVDAKRAWLRGRGCHHTLMVPGRNGCVADPWTVALRSVPLPLSHGYRIPLGIRSAVKSLVSLKPNLVEAEDAWHLAWAVLRARDALRVPAVAFCHSNLPRWLAMRCGRSVERGAIRYCRRLYRHFDLVLAPSAHLAVILQSWGISRAQYQPLGVDLTIFSPRWRTSALRKRLEIGKEMRLLIYAGRFAAEKNLGDLADAMRRLGSSYVLLLVGAGKLPAELPANVRVINYVRQREELAALLANCDAFVHAGDQETFGLAALEAMACGLPVVGADAAGIGELIGSGAGIAVKPRSAEALADGIERLFKQDLAAIGARSRRIAERYAWDRVLSDLLQRYRGLCALN